MIEELNYEQEQDMILRMKNFIYDNYPVLEDRRDVLNKDKELNIRFAFIKGDDDPLTRISLYFTNRNIIESSIGEIMAKGLVSKKMVNDLITFILNDHDVFYNILSEHRCDSMNFRVDMLKGNKRGIGVRKINLKLDYSFYSDYQDLQKDYLESIISEFYPNIENTEIYQNAYEDHCHDIKTDVINNYNDLELKQFISQLDSEDIKKVILKMPNELFLKIYNEKKEDKEKIKKIMLDYSK